MGSYHGDYDTRPEGKWEHSAGQALGLLLQEVLGYGASHLYAFKTHFVSLKLISSTINSSHFLYLPPNKS